MRTVAGCFDQSGRLHEDGHMADPDSAPGASLTGEGPAPSTGVQALSLLYIFQSV
jgi:hypothetical protein